MFVFRYRSPQHWLDVFKTFYGPMLKAFGALDARQAGRRCAATCSRSSAQFNRATTARWSVPSEYLEVVITKN